MKTQNTNNRSQPKNINALGAALLGLGLALTSTQSLAEAARRHPTAAPAGRGGECLVQTAALQREAQRLPSEMDIPQFSPLARRWAALPRTTNLVNTVHHDHASRVAVYTVGRPDADRVVVGLHGLFGDHTCWKYVAAALGDDYQLWLIDLPGCGGSESPDAAALGPGGYGPKALADRALQVVEAKLAGGSKPKRLILAGHSLGGMIVLRMFGDDELRQRHAATLAAVDGLVLFAPSDVVVTQATEDWLTVLGLNGVKVGIGDFTGLLQKAVKDSVRISYSNPAMATRELCDNSVSAFRHGANRRANQAILRDAIPWLEFGKRPNWPAIRDLESGYRNVKTPCLIAWGDCDQTLSSSMGYKIKDQLPNARLVVVPQSMHLLPLERPEVSADLIRQFDRQLATGTLAAARSVSTLELVEGSRLMVQR